MGKKYIHNTVKILKNPWVTRIYLVTLLLCVGFYFYMNIANFKIIFYNANLKILFMAFIPYFLVVGVINPYLHKISYKSIGTNVTFWQAFRIFHLSRIGNYLPGRIWFAGNYYIFSKKLNIDNQSIAKNFVMLNIALFLMGGICSLPIVFHFMPSLKTGVVIFTCCMVLFIHPKIFTKLFSIIWDKDKVKSYSVMFLLKALLLFGFSYTILGLALYLTTYSFENIPIQFFPLVTGASAASLVCGLLAVFAPAGIGVMEGVRVGVLGSLVSFENALMAVVALRLIQVLIDFSCAFVSAVSVWNEERMVRRPTYLKT